MAKIKKMKRQTALLLIGVICSIIISLALFIVPGVTADTKTVNGGLAFAAENSGFDYLSFTDKDGKETDGVVRIDVPTADESDGGNGKPYILADGESKNVALVAGLVVVSCAFITLTVLFGIYLYFNRKKVQQLEKARASAENANKAKSEFLSDVSHDIRTPLNAIVGMTAIATANIDDKEQVLNCLKKISLSTGNLLELIDDVKAKNEADAEADKKEIDLTGKRILVAEDNDLNLEIAELLLTGAGLQVDHAENGQDCLDKFLSKKPGYYDAILMDIRMPVMNGLETTAYIRGLNRKYKSIPIIAMTADALSEDIQKCLDCGMNAHISKPIDIESVKATLAKFIKTE